MIVSIYFYSEAVVFRNFLKAKFPLFTAASVAGCVVKLIIRPSILPVILDGVNYTRSARHVAAMVLAPFLVLVLVSVLSLLLSPTLYHFYIHFYLHTKVKMNIEIEGERKSPYRITAILFLSSDNEVTATQLDKIDL